MNALTDADINDMDLDVLEGWRRGLNHVLTRDIAEDPIAARVSLNRVNAAVTARRDLLEGVEALLA